MASLGGGTLVESESSIRYRGWGVVFACFVMAVFCWGLGFYGQGVYLAELERRHAWPPALIAGASTFYYLFSAVLLIFVSDLIEKIGPRALVLGGAVLLAAATAAVGMVETPWQLYAAYLVMAFAWAAMSAASIATIVGLWFDARRGLAISLALTGASCGGIFVVPALVAGIGWVGFPIATAAAAGVIVAILIPILILFVGRPPAEIEPPAFAGNRSAGRQADSAPRLGTLRRLAFWSVAAPFALAFAAQVGFLVHQIAFLEPQIGRSRAGLAVAATTSMALVGRLFLGAVADRLDRRALTAASFLSQAVALVVMTRTSDANLLLGASALFGFSVGNIITLPPLIIQREFDTADFGMVVGLSTAVTQITYAFGPAVLGLLRSASGSYTGPLYLCIGLEVTAAALILLGGRRTGRKRLDRVD